MKLTEHREVFVLILGAAICLPIFGCEDDADEGPTGGALQGGASIGGATGQSGDTAGSEPGGDAQPGGTAGARPRAAWAVPAPVRLAMS